MSENIKDQAVLVRYLDTNSDTKANTNNVFLLVQHRLWRDVKWPKESKEKVIWLSPKDYHYLCNFPFERAQKQKEKLMEQLLFKVRLKQTNAELLEKAKVFSGEDQEIAELLEKIQSLDSKEASE